MNVAERLHAKTDRSLGDAGCWPFAGYRDRNGYGALWLGRWATRVHLRRTERAHRVAWVLANGPIPDGLWVLHRCDNPPCVNPSHLFLGTYYDNRADMIEKGRQGWWPLVSGRERPGRPRGSQHGRAKLTEDQVREILALLGTMTQADIARRFGVSQNVVLMIRTGRTWTHVEGARQAGRVEYGPLQRASAVANARVARAALAAKRTARRSGAAA